MSLDRSRRDPRKWPTDESRRSRQCRLALDRGGRASPARHPAKWARDSAGRCAYSTDVHRARHAFAHFYCAGRGMARSSLGPTLAPAAPAAPSRPLAGVWTCAGTSVCRPGIKLGTRGPVTGVRGDRGADGRKRRRRATGRRVAETWLAAAEPSRSGGWRNCSRRSMGGGGSRTAQLALPGKRHA